MARAICTRYNAFPDLLAALKLAEMTIANLSSDIKRGKLIHAHASDNLANAAQSARAAIAKAEAAK